MIYVSLRKELAQSIKRGGYKMRRRRPHYKHELTKSKQIKKALKDNGNLILRYATVISLLEPVIKDIIKLVIKVVHYLFK